MEKEMCENCSHKQTIRTDEEKTKLIHRLNRVEGQIRGIKRMVEENAYCADILIQSSAASAAIYAFNKDVVESHLRGCVARDLKEGKDEVIDEFVSLILKMVR